MGTTLSSNWNWLSIYLQPFIDVKEKKICGCETLIRHKTCANVTAKDILRAIRQTNSMIDFDIHILDTVCKSIAVLNDEDESLLDVGLPLTPNNALRHKEYGRVNINLSPETISTSSVAKEILAILSFYRCLDRVKLEISELSAFDDREVEANINYLINHGVTLSLDDFNSVNYNMNALGKYEINEVKLTSNKDLMFNDKYIIIMRNIAQMFNCLGLSVIVEGIETINQLQLAESLGFSKIQGYLFSRPTNILDYTDTYIRNTVYRNIQSVYSDERMKRIEKDES